MKGKSFELLRYTVTEEQREQRMLEIGRTKTFLYFLEEKTIDEQRCLLAEINKIMEERVPLTEFLLIGMEYRNMVGESDYRKIAIFCFAETLNEIISQNKDRTRSLEETPYFLETYNKVFDEIIDYIKDVTFLIWNNFIDILIKYPTQWEGWLYLHRFHVKWANYSTQNDIDTSKYIFSPMYDLYCKENRFYVYNYVNEMRFAVSEYIYKIFWKLKTSNAYLPINTLNHYIKELHIRDILINNSILIHPKVVNI